MGSGKSAVGKQLARLLRLPFYDSDTEIERRTGVDIPFIFEKEGETGFRQRERETIEVLTAMEPSCWLPVAGLSCCLKIVGCWLRAGGSSI